MAKTNFSRRPWRGTLRLRRLSKTLLIADNAAQHSSPVAYQSIVKIFRHLRDFPASLQGGAITIGNFDGVHRGHARIVERLRQQAQAAGGAAVVFTFDPHPVRLLRPDQAPPPLTWTDRKAELLDELGVDAMIAYATDEELLKLTPEEFFASIVCQQLAAKAIVEGPNFRFGCGRSGDVMLLAKLAAERQMAFELVEPLVQDGQIVSSSRVRQLIAAGQIDASRQLLTRPYRIRGMVVHGAGRGNKLGFPTANLDAVDTLLPGPGVYAGRCWIAGQPHPAAVHIGPNPTFSEHALKVEVHVLDWQDPLYGQPLEVDFLAQVRGVHKFASVDELREQLAKDIAAVRQLWAAEP